MDWHWGGDYPADLPPGAAATHIGMFFAWAAHTALLETSSTADTRTLQARENTPGAFLIEHCDGALTVEMFTAGAYDFVVAYYDADTESFLDDYIDEFADEVESIYHIPDSWETYSRIAPHIDQRFTQWLTDRETS